MQKVNGTAGSRRCIIDSSANTEPCLLKITIILFFLCSITFSVIAVSVRLAIHSMQQSEQLGMFILPSVS